MTYTTLIAATELQALTASGQPLMVFDCSFDLTSPSAGAQQFAQAHIPGAVYADLDKNLSAKHGAPGAHGTLVAQEADQPASGGRHPLPSRERFAMWLSSVGFSNDMQAVVYDRQGANYCGRLWWMLKWAGHDAVAVLDGGLQAWQAAGGAVASGDEPAHFQSHFTLHTPLRRLVTASEVLQNLQQPTQTVGDARATPRYRGETEPLDPVAGHIPGALNRPFGLNRVQTAASSPQHCCAPSSMNFWQAVTLTPWCTNAAAGSAPSPTCWPWKSQVSEKHHFLRAAGANGAATRRVRSSGAEQPWGAAK